MIDISIITSNANVQIANAIASVTKGIRRVLIAAGIPSEVAEKYSANQCTGGEWVLDNEDGTLATHDYHFTHNAELVDLVRRIEKENNEDFTTLW